MLHISHHERVEGHPHRWHVFVHGRTSLEDLGHAWLLICQDELFTVGSAAGLARAAA
jgi:hypothetical protein